MQIPLQPIGANNIATAHYWVLTAPDALLHPDPRHPIVMTNFGQTHGVEDRRLIVDALRLPFLKNDLVVQIELDGLSPSVKRELFSTTRDRLKRGSRYNALIEAIVEALGDDQQLQLSLRGRRHRRHALVADRPAGRLWCGEFNDMSRHKINLPLIAANWASRDPSSSGAFRLPISCA